MIKIENLTKNYGEKNVFNNFNIQIESETITAIVGASGSGKTTLLNIIGLLDVEYAGKLIINTTDTTNLKGQKRLRFIRENLNYLFQDYALIETESVEYNLLLALEYTKLSRSDKSKIINEALTKVGMENFNHHKVYTLSGGEQQRVSLARTMIKPGNVILADEPTGNLDQDNSAKVLSILYKLKEDGKTIILVTHDLELAQKCDNIIELK